MTAARATTPTVQAAWLVMCGMAPPVLRGASEAVAAEVVADGLLAVGVVDVLEPEAAVMLEAGAAAVVVVAAAETGVWRLSLMIVTGENMPTRSVDDKVTTVEPALPSLPTLPE